MIEKNFICFTWLMSHNLSIIYGDRLILKVSILDEFHLIKITHSA